jgi:dihydroorotase
MILRNARIVDDKSFKQAIILIKDQIIQEVILNPLGKDILRLKALNEDGSEINCDKRLIIPSLIDIHAHLRDMDQSYKETFSSGTLAALTSGVNCVFNMPNTSPVANNIETIKSWMERAKNNIYVDVGFIAGIPANFDKTEIEEIIKLGIFGFKIYPLDPISGIDWLNSLNFKKLLSMSSSYHIPIFIHPDWPVNKPQMDSLRSKILSNDSNPLKIYDQMFPSSQELKFIDYALNNYQILIKELDLRGKDYPIIHFCHVSSIESFKLLASIQEFNISFEVTPHHLLLSNSIKLDNFAIGKVLPPLRTEDSRSFLFKKFEEGEIQHIATDHAPHSKEEKARSFDSAPSGFPAYGAYPFLFLDKIYDNALLIDYFIQATSINPSSRFDLKHKGAIVAGNEANLIILEKGSPYAINPELFYSKAKYSPFLNSDPKMAMTTIRTWKIIFHGEILNLEELKPKGRIILNSQNPI